MCLSSILLWASVVSVPPMGWSSWNACGSGVTAAAVASNAEALVRLGLAEKGYRIVSIDSSWQGRREKRGGGLPLQPNERFPDMRGLVGRIHALGLKAGIYSTPMVVAWGSTDDRLYRGSTGYPLDPKWFHKQFGGCGEKRFEADDARQWAEWGFDFLKYDWPDCDLEHTRAIRAALDATGRDIQLQLCTGARPEWMAEYRPLAQLVRGTVDAFDEWPRIRRIVRDSDRWAGLSGPGCWADLDMLALGPVVIDRDKPDVPAANRLTDDEAFFHFAFWAFYPSPLFISCDLTRIDAKTLALLSHKGLLAINQDPLGKMASFRELPNGVRIYERDLAGGEKGWGVFNLSDAEQAVDEPLGGSMDLTDVGRNVSVGCVMRLRCDVPPHGARIFRGRMKLLGDRPRVTVR